MMRKIAAIMLAFLLVASAALADTVVGEEGDSYVRSGPGRDYAQLGVLGEGETAQYLDSTRYDERGVAWYNVLMTARPAGSPRAIRACRPAATEMPTGRTTPGGCVPRAGASICAPARAPSMRT